jgi:hypothetical protein
MPDKQTRKNTSIGHGKPGPGRPKGSKNKITALLKDAILMDAERGAARLAGAQTTSIDLGMACPSHAGKRYRSLFWLINEIAPHQSLGWYWF